MALRQSVARSDDESLMSDLWCEDIADNPMAFVRYAFPWGERNTPLEHFDGPRVWQCEILLDIRRHIAENKNRAANGLPPEMFKLAVSSGRGIGKSALVAWLILWMLSTRLGSTVIVSANTEAQLKSVTWGELGKWLTLAINGHWFEINSMRLSPAAWLAQAVKRDLKIDDTYWYAEAKLWKEENPDAYAGVHNPLGLALFFDEASGIPSSIWRVSDGYFTEPVASRYQFAFSNPRRNTGSFFECFHKDRNYWRTRQIDSRTVEGTDQGVYAKIIEQYGEDSDAARVEVMGRFPRQGDQQFISRDVVAAARERKVEFDAGAPLLMGVDVARFGDDQSVIAWRQGRDASDHVPPWVSYKGMDTNQLSLRVAEMAEKYRPDMIFVDGGGVGGGVVDRLKAMRFRVCEVQFGSRAEDSDAYANKRTEIWARMREWLLVGSIPGLAGLDDDLLGPEYSLREPASTMVLESKESMKKRGLASPDYADALANTFAMTIARKDMRSSSRRVRETDGLDYPLFG
jgi:hypothetical protein